MCGILAVLSRSATVDAAAAGASLDLMTRRGPDGEGVCVRLDGRLLLGSRRLAVIDADGRSGQPMSDPETGATAVFNGAIYNYVELRAELASLGIRFRTQGDTEVLLAAFRRWGPAAFERFNGMWAAIIHEPATDTIVVSRDRLGVKPLYLRDDGRTLVLASTPRAVLAAAGAAAAVDERAVFDFLTTGRTDSADRCFYDGVVPFPAGTLWRIAADGRIRERLEIGFGASAPAGDDEALRALLVDAVRLRLRTDRQVGMLLSSGIDSSALAWAAREGRTGDGRVAAFYGYGYGDGHPFDETSAAADFAAGLGDRVPFHRVTVEPTPDLASIEALLAAQEEPVTTVSALAALRLFRRMRDDGLTVALTGEGSDELFCGYTGQMAPVLAVERLRRRQFGDAWRIARSGHTSRLSLAARAAWNLPPAALMRLLRRTRSNVAAMSEEFWRRSVGQLEDIRADERGDFRTWVRRGIRRTFLPHVLRHADRNGMANAIEVRCPFLDHRLVAFALDLAQERLLDHRGGKLALRDAFRDVLPRRIVEARKSRGLGHAEQFAVGRLDLADLLREPPDAAARFVDVRRLDRLLQQRPDDPRLWWPVCLLLWLRRLERAPA